ncbi:hypothetical protein [Streptomyces sp. NPDC002671]
MMERICGKNSAPAKLLDAAEGDQGLGAGRDAAAQGGDGEELEAGEEHPLVAHDVAESAAVTRNSPYTRTYAPTVISVAETEACRSARMDGMATLTM